MLRRLGVAALVFGSGCASLLGPLMTYEDSTDKHNNSPSKFGRCGTSGYIVGGGIDAVIGAGDLLLGDELDYVDVLVIAPLALDVLIGTVEQINCHKGD